jgi:dephospho-CoA kinase
MPTVTVALTGGIGAGKTEALRAFARRGVPTQSADEIVHRLIAEDPEVRSALEERWGTTDRARIAEIVFADREQLACWAAPPACPTRKRHGSTRWTPRSPSRDPLLYEPAAKRFDVVVVITAPAGFARRARSTRPPTPAGAADPDERKWSADFAYVNDGTLESSRLRRTRIQHLQA